MDAQTFIESGIIEAYVLGFATAAETAEVERMAAQYPEVSSALLQAELALKKVGESISQTPPPHVKTKIWDTLGLDQKTQTPPPLLPVRKIERIPAYLKWAAAASLFLLASTLFLWIQNNRLQSRERQLQSDLSRVQSQKDSIAQVAGKLGHPQTKKIFLPGTPGHTDALAIVYYNTETKTVFVDPTKMPVVSPGKQYQLWAIVAGKPVDLGMINETPNFQGMKGIGSPEMFAITLEPRGGSPQPTLDQMFVAGKPS